MPPPTQKLRRKPLQPWARFCAVLGIVLLAAWGALEFGQRYLGIHKLVIERVSISGCQWDRLAEVQKIADDLCLGKPLFFFDAGALQARIESLRWVKALLIKREPPDRISIVIEERQPLFMLLAESGELLVMSEDGIIVDRVNQSNLAPIPVVAARALEEKDIIHLILAARDLKAQQPDFYARLAEIRWTDRWPTVFLDGLQAPIYLSRNNPAKNIPSFQALFLQLYAGRPGLGDVRYFDLRWDNQISVGELQESAPPQVQNQR